MQDRGDKQQFKSSLETTISKHATLWKQGKLNCNFFLIPVIISQEFRKLLAPYLRLYIVLYVVYRITHYFWSVLISTAMEIMYLSGNY